MVRHFEVLLGTRDRTDAELNFDSNALAIDNGVSLFSVLS